MKQPTENQTLALCLVLALVGIALRLPSIHAGDWPGAQPSTQQQVTTMEEDAFVAAMQRRIPEVPRTSAVIKHGNEDMDAIAESVLQAEASGCVQRMAYGNAQHGGSQ